LVEQRCEVTKVLGHHGGNASASPNEGPALRVLRPRPTLCDATARGEHDRRIGEGQELSLDLRPEQVCARDFDDEAAAVDPPEEVREDRGPRECAVRSKLELSQAALPPAVG
jgi:hypothetical protein